MHLEDYGLSISLVQFHSEGTKTMFLVSKEMFNEELVMNNVINFNWYYQLAIYRNGKPAFFTREFLSSEVHKHIEDIFHRLNHPNGIHL